MYYKVKATVITALWAMTKQKWEQLAPTDSRNNICDLRPE